MLKRKICIMLSVIACLCLGFVGIMQIVPNKMEASASQTYEVGDFKMLDKASVRKNVDNNGIRFATFIGSESSQAASSYWDSYEMGTLFMPKAAIGAGQELTIDGEYSGMTPVAAVFDGNTDNLVSDQSFANGKLFNAVLDLSNYDENSNALNYKIVARTYLKEKSTGTVTYLSAVEFAPAYVAAKALDADEDDTNGTLAQYVSKVELAIAGYNLEIGGVATLDVTTDVEGIEVTFDAAEGLLDNVYTAGSTAGLVTLKAKAAGEAINKDVIVSVFGDQAVERKYYAEVDARQTNTTGSIYRNSESEYLTVKAFNVDDVIYNGKTLRETKDYVIDADKNELSIEKAVLATEKRANELIIESSVSGNINVAVNLYYEGEELLPGALASYLDSEAQYDILAYRGIRDSSMAVDQDGVKGGTIDKYDSGINFITDGYIEDFYDANLGGLLVQSVGYIGNHSKNPTLESATKLYTTMEAAEALGQDGTVMISDGLCWAWVEETYEKYYKSYPLNWKDIPETYSKPTLIGTAFANKTVMINEVKKSLARYINHPAFGGIVLYDEPGVVTMPLVAEIYLAIQEVYEDYGCTDKKIIANLSPYYDNSGHYPNPGTANRGTGDAAYRAYIQYWFELTGAKEIQVDIYSLYSNAIGEVHIPCLQIMAEEAAKNNAKIAIINSAWQRTGTERFHTYEDMAWMNNLTLAYGAYDFGYYTYHTLNDEETQVVKDGASMIDRQGRKTEIYDYAREINAKAQILAPVILNFDYVQGSVYTASYNKAYVNKMNSNFDSDYMNSKTYAKLDSVVANDSTNAWLVNELKDDTNGAYMYAVMNIIDSLKNSTDYNVGKSITLTFDNVFTHAWVYRNGRFTVETLTDGAITLDGIVAGDCAYVIPFNDQMSEPVDSDTVVKPNWGSNIWTALPVVDPDEVVDPEWPGLWA